MTKNEIKELVFLLGAFIIVVVILGTFSLNLVWPFLQILFFDWLGVPQVKQFDTFLAFHSHIPGIAIGVFIFRGTKLGRRYFDRLIELYRRLYEHEEQDKP
jgi:hypothetical protein